ncbi:RES family NAD+ phosphorylase [Sabulicella glaciei]|uniref:RES family NAD+ phosphorylase n=1 Tax=Sabulicella glaciei TaxID=2984948 RepID=UPI00349FD1E2
MHGFLAIPFRYAPFPRGSRFRRAGQREGCLYAAEDVRTVMAKDAFYRLLFVLDAPTARPPRNPIERTAFRFRYAKEAGVDLTAPPLSANTDVWAYPASYASCQDLADAARRQAPDSSLALSPGPGWQGQPRDPRVPSNRDA